MNDVKERRAGSAACHEFACALPLFASVWKRHVIFPSFYSVWFMCYVLLVALFSDLSTFLTVLFDFLNLLSVSDVIIDSPEEWT